MNIPFVEFPKMPRLSREIIITEKIDGTNASVTITEDGQFLTGSRTRWITPDNTAVLSSKSSGPSARSRYSSVWTTTWVEMRLIR